MTVAVLELVGVVKEYPGDPPVVALAGVEFLLPSGEAGGASNRLHNVGRHDANRRDLGAARRTAFFDRRAAFC